MRFNLTIALIMTILVLSRQYVAVKISLKSFAKSNNLLRSFFAALVICLLVNSPLIAQPCTGGTPSFTLNLTGNNDSVWTSPNTGRAGTCCGSSNCVEFNVVIDPNSTGIQIDIISGAIPSGSLSWKVACGVAQTFGAPVCLTGTGPFRITFCKNGNNSNIYQISAIPKHGIVGHAAGSSACGVYMKAQGYNTSGLTWTSVPSNATNNSYLSCKTGCDSVSVVPGPVVYPLSLTYKVCGTVIGGCVAGTICDTLNVKLVDNPIVSITPDNAVVCYGSGTNTTLTANASKGLPPYHYLWNTGDTSRSITKGTGTYIVSVTDSLGCVVAKDTTTITVFSAPFVANASNDTIICASLNTVSLRGQIQNAPGGQWSGGTGRFIPDNTTLDAIYVPSPTEIAAGYVNLVLTSTGNLSCNPARDTLHVSINQAPTPAVTGPLNLCEFSSGYTYSSPFVPGDYYDWHVVGGNISSGQGSSSISVNWLGSGPGYIYMIQTAVSGCQAVGSLQTISRFDLNVNPITKATIGPDAISSDADAYSNGLGYQITSNCGGGKGADIVIPGSVFDRGKMCMTFSFQRDENEADFFNRGGTRFYITGGQLSIQMRISNGGVGFTDIGPLITTYTVPNDDNFKYFTFCYDSASGVARVLVNDSIVWSYQATANRSLYWTGAGNAVMGSVMDGSCSGKTLMDFINIAIPVSIYPRPNPVISGPSPACAYRNTYTYTVPADPLTSTYLWTVSGGTIVSGAGTTSISVRWGAPGTGTVSLKQTYTSTNCDTTVTKSVTINPTPIPVISGFDSVCINKTYTYSVSAVAGNTYLWTVSGGGTIVGSSTSSSLVVKWGAVAGSRALTLKQTHSNGCDSTVTKTITISPPPTPVITGSLVTCQNKLYNYSVTAVAGQTYTWVATGGTINGSNKNNLVQVRWGVPSSGTITVTQSVGSGCDSTVAKNITIQSAPKPVISGPDSSCENKVQSYQVNPVATNTYSWVASGGTILGSATSNLVQVQWGVAGTGTVTVTQITATGCDSTISKNVTKIAKPVPVIGGNGSACSTKTSSFTVSPAAGSSFLWTVGGGTIAGINTDTICTIVWGVAGTGTVTVKQTNYFGCDSTVFRNITINPLPIPVITGDTMPCASKTKIYSVVAAAGNSYLWTAIGGTISGSSTSNLVTVMWGAAGTGTLTLRQTNTQGCITTVVQNINILSLPGASTLYHY